MKLNPAAARVLFKDENQKANLKVNHGTSIGIYEKATPKHFSWQERLEFAKEMGFTIFNEMSVDESDARLARLTWSNV